MRENLTRTIFKIFCLLLVVYCFCSAGETNVVIHFTYQQRVKGRHFIEVR